MHCHNCNSERPPGAAYCPTCGASTVEASKGSSTSLAPIVMVAVVVVALVLGGVAFITTQDPASDADTIVSTSTTLPPTTAQPPPRIGELVPTAEDPLQGLMGSIPYATFSASIRSVVPSTSSSHRL